LYVKLEFVVKCAAWKRSVCSAAWKGSACSVDDKVATAGLK
jgi:hypothetical protein